MAGPDPAPLDRRAVERVLRRASELSPTPVDPGDAIDEAVLLAAAQDAGLPVPAVRRALAIERLGDPPATSALDRLAGPRRVVADREVPARLDESLRGIDEWLVVGHHLRRARSRPDAGEWERRSDMAGALQRSVRKLTGEGRLGSVRLVAGRAAPVDEHHTMVRLEADVAAARTAALAGGGSVAAVGTTAAVVGALVATPVLAVGAPVAIAVGVLIMAGGGRNARSLARELERLLDRVERRDAPAGLSRELRRRVSSRRDRR